MSVEKLYVTWDDMTKYIDELVDEMNKKGIRPTGVYGIPRGGLILATLVSYKMDIPLLMGATDGCLIIDDIADSGRTLIHYTSNDTQFNKYFIATMFYHERSLVKPDFYIHEKKDNWIVFPYEYDN